MCASYSWLHIVLEIGHITSTSEILELWKCTPSRILGLVALNWPNTSSPKYYNVPKTRQISESIGEEVPWRENLPVILEN
jgi:hypothetical protein